MDKKEPQNQVFTADNVTVVINGAREVAPAKAKDAPAVRDHASHTEPTKAPQALNAKAWDDEEAETKKHPWKMSPQGRLGIRLITRGVLGASAFAWGLDFAGQKMKGYNQHGAAKNWVQAIAKFWDVVAGKPIKALGNALGRDGERWVTFRPTKQFYDTQYGRTLGHEIVGVTFDFAAMSIADGMGRDLADAMDPNVKKTWMKDGHIDYKELGKTWAYNAWKYVSYNQGEDWAVALPYVYFVRGQRNLINKISPGFGFDSDRNLNGGSFKVDDKGHVVGNYSLEGLLDLQSRFTVYNMGTLMYREAYTEAAQKLKQWKAGGYQAPDINVSMKGIADGAKSVAHWAARDVIKGGVYMTPAVPFFWMTRTPQTKYRGLFINPKKGVMSYSVAGTDVKQLVHANELQRETNKSKAIGERFTENTEVFFQQFDGVPGAKRAIRDGWHPTGAAENPFQKDGEFDAYAHRGGVFDSAFNAIGSWNNWLRKKMHKPVRVVEGKLGMPLVSEYRAKTHMDRYINAAVAYTPYFYMKSDILAKAWDTGRMDVASERVVDGIAHLNWGEFSAGCGEIWRSMWHRPFDDPEREVLAQHRICEDDTPADGQNFQAHQKNCVQNELHKTSQKTGVDYTPYIHTSYEVEQPEQPVPVHQQLIAERKLAASKRLSDFKTDCRSCDTPKPAASWVEQTAKRGAAIEPAPDKFTTQELARQSTEEVPSPGVTIH